jgi:aspartate/methionine/tyrosine aminotransferase
MAGAKPVPIVLEESRKFRFGIETLAASITPRTRMIVINTPQNPTGGCYSLEDLRMIATWRENTTC